MVAGFHWLVDHLGQPRAQGAENVISKARQVKSFSLSLWRGASFNSTWSSCDSPVWFGAVVAVLFEGGPTLQSATDAHIFGL